MYIFDGNLLKLKVEEGYELVEHPGASACIIYFDNKILLVRQYRKALKEYTWEIPAGKIDKSDENPKSTVLREVFEETGINLNESKLIYLGKIYTTPGFSNEIIHIFFYKLEENQDLKPQQLDEISEVKFFSKSEFFDLVRKNEIKDAKTLSSISIAIAHNLI